MPRFIAEEALASHGNVFNIAARLKSPKISAKLFGMP